jgi:stage V sporulation protein R
MYKELVTQQNKEVFSILEPVLNTVPSHAFLRSSDTYLQNVLVIAHVFGHADFFANNHWYRKFNKNMLNEAEQHARLIRTYEEQYDRDRIEKLLDALLTVAASVNAFERNSQGAVQTPHLLLSGRSGRPWRILSARFVEAIWDEAEYFDLIQRTHIINEGWATSVEAKRKITRSRQNLPSQNPEFLA